MAFLFTSTKKPIDGPKDRPLKIKIHFQDVLPKYRKQTLSKKEKFIKTPQKTNDKKKEVKETEKKRETKTILFRAAVVSKIKGLIKGKIPYPYIARVKNMEGDIHYTLTLSQNGETALYKMTRSSGHPLLDQTVKDFFLKNPLKGKIGFYKHSKKILTIKDQILFRIERL